MMQSIPSYQGPEQVIQLMGYPTMKKKSTDKITHAVRARIRPWTKRDAKSADLTGWPVMVVQGETPNLPYSVGMFVFKDSLNGTENGGDHHLYLKDPNSGAHLIAIAWLAAQGIKLDGFPNSTDSLMDWAQDRGLDLAVERLIRFFLRGCQIEPERWWETSLVKHLTFAPQVEGGS